MSIVVTTPTGNIGRRVVERLLAAGAPVRVLARDAARLAPEVRAGAEVVEGDLGDAGALRRVTQGAEALFLLVPPDLATDDWRGSQYGIGVAAADAIARNGVEHVVFVSSGGAHRRDLTAVSRLGVLEGMLEEAAPHVISPRAGYFMENFLGAIPTIRAQGALFGGASPEVRAAIVATEDIGDVAAELLLDRRWTGHHVRGVHGPADLSFPEAALILSEVLERPVNYVQVPAEGLRGAFLGMGASAVVAEEYTRMIVGLAASGFEREPRSPETTTPTTLADWARGRMLPAFRGTEAAVPA